MVTTIDFSKKNRLQNDKKIVMAKEIREKKVEVNVNGRIIRVMPHMVHNMEKFGASETMRIIKEPPKELMHPLPKKLLLTKVELPKEELPEKPTAEFPKESVLPVEPLNVPPDIIPPILPTKPVAKKTLVKKTTKKSKK